MVMCAACNGSGTWETECCNGWGGCSCRGGLVAMGPCRGCGGRGEVPIEHNDPGANTRWLYSTRACFIGSGPASGYWANAPALGIG